MLVLDEAGQVISRGMADGYAGTGGSTYAPQGAHSAELGARLGTSRQIGRSVLACEADGESCRVMAVIGGDDVLGSTALFHRAELDDTAVRTFERSSSVIGIVLLSQERMEATKSRERVDPAALIGLAAPGRAGAAGRTRPSATASISPSRSR